MVDDERLPMEPGEKAETRIVRFRTLGCYPLTGAIESEATTLEDIVAEMQVARGALQAVEIEKSEAAAAAVPEAAS